MSGKCMPEPNADDFGNNSDFRIKSPDELLKYALLKKGKKEAIKVVKQDQFIVQDTNVKYSKEISANNKVVKESKFEEKKEEVKPIVVQERPGVVEKKPEVIEEDIKDEEEEGVNGEQSPDTQSFFVGLIHKMKRKHGHEIKKWQSYEKQIHNWREQVLMVVKRLKFEADETTKLRALLEEKEIEVQSLKTQVIKRKKK